MGKIGKDHSITAGRYTSISAQVARAFSNFKRYRTDPRGVLRHIAGDTQDVLFGYLPERPAYGLKLIKNEIFNFITDQDIISDVMDAVNYKWVRKTDGGGTALSIQSVRTGEALVTTGPFSGNFQFYQMPHEVAQVGGAKGMWLEWRVKLSEVVICDLFVGVCNTIPGGQNLFDNRLNAVGFRKDSGDNVIDLESTAAGVVTTGVSNSTMADDTYVRLGFKYYPKDGHLFFFVNDTFKARIMTGLPSALMALSFGIRTGIKAEKSLRLSKIVFSIEEDD